MYFTIFLANNNKYISVSAHSTHWIDIWAYREFFWTPPHTSTIQSWDSTHYCGNKVHNRTQTLMWVRDNIVCSISHVHPNINYFFSLLSVLTKAQVYFTGTRIPDPPPFFPHLVPPAIMVWIIVWKYIFEPFIHILQHFVLQLSRSTNFCF
jgi:hypothetical protein